MKKFKLCDVNRLPKMSGIYSITNELNGDRYIGSTNDFKRRLTHHRSDLRMQKHHSVILQRAYDKYGEHRFYIEILETCEPIQETLFLLEQKYLDLKPKYNVSLIANRPPGFKGEVSEETRQKIRLSNLGKKASEVARKHMSEAQRKKSGKKVDQYTLEGKYLKTFNRTVDAGKSLGDYYKYVQIVACCRGKLRSAHGYLWKYHDDPRNIFDVIKPKSKDNKRPVVCLTKDGKYITEFPSILEAAKILGNSTNSGTINKVLHGKNKTAFGYKWKYKEDYERSIV